MQVNPPAARWRVAYSTVQIEDTWPRSTVKRQRSHLLTRSRPRWRRGAEPFGLHGGGDSAARADGQVPKRMSGGTMTEWRCRAHNGRNTFEPGAQRDVVLASLGDRQQKATHWNHACSMTKAAEPGAASMQSQRTSSSNGKERLGRIGLHAPGSRRSSTCCAHRREMLIFFPKTRRVRTMQPGPAHFRSALSNDATATATAADCSRHGPGEHWREVSALVCTIMRSQRTASMSHFSTTTDRTQGCLVPISIGPPGRISRARPERGAD